MRVTLCSRRFSWGIDWNAFRACACSSSLADGFWDLLASLIRSGDRGVLGLSLASAFSGGVDGGLCFLLLPMSIFLCGFAPVRRPAASAIYLASISLASGRGVLGVRFLWLSSSVKASLSEFRLPSARSDESALTVPESAWLISRFDFS